MAHSDLQVSEAENGRILVVDPVEGHAFEYRLATGRGVQSLDSMVPRWAGGTEPASPERYVIEAKQLAEREAIDRGWLGT
jgi:hypothetical protein